MTAETSLEHHVRVGVCRGAGSATHATGHPADTQDHAAETTGSRIRAGDVHQNREYLER